MRIFIALMLAAALVGCNDDKKPPSGGGGVDAPEAADPDAKPYKADPATQGSVTGKAIYKGAAPAPRRVSVACEGSAHPEVEDETLLVNADGTLRNVFVYVVKGTKGWKFDPPATPVVLDQKNCTYAPHVFGIQVGQMLQVNNSDGTMHNVHSLAKENDPFNKMQNAGQKDFVTMRTSEIVQLKCDVHSWMGAWAGVVNHPFYNVTGDGGTFELTGLPEGEYTIRAWHERLGKLSQTVKVEAGQQAPIEFVFEGK